MVSEQNLFAYLGKDIEIACIDGDSVIGHVMGVSPAADTDDGEACIAIQLPSLAVCYEFSQSEIKSIKVIECAETRTGKIIKGGESYVTKQQFIKQAKELGYADDQIQSMLDTFQKIEKETGIEPKYESFPLIQQPVY